MTEARFFTVSPGFHPFTPPESLFCATGNVLDLFLPVGGVFTASAQKFGDFLAGNPNAELFKQQLQLYGHLAHAAGDYAHNKYVKVGGHSFPRIVSAVLRISKTDGSLCGYLFRTVWLEAESEIEDANLDGHKDGPQKAEKIAIRRSQRNLNYGLARLFTHENRLECLKEHKMGKPRMWFDTLSRETYVRDFANRVINIDDHDAAICFGSLKKKDSNNPAHLSAVFNINVATAIMEAHDCDPRYLNLLAYTDNKLDFDPNSIWRLEPKDLLWEKLQSTFFPDHPRPDIDTKTPEFKQAVRQRAAIIASRTPEAARGASPEEKKLFKEQCYDDAFGHVYLAFQSAMHVKLETSSRELLAEANNKRIADAIAAALVPQQGDTDAKVADRVGLCRLNAQKVNLRALKVLVQQDKALNESYIAIREHMTKFLQKNGNKLYWEKQRSPHMSNLTPFGEDMAERSLVLEADGCYMVHRQALVVLLAALHVPIRCLLQPNLLIVGKYASGKSRALLTAEKSLIEGTWKEVTATSDKSHLGENSEFFTDDKAEFAEELQPSLVGLDGSDGKKTKSTDTAMTDKASMWRASATGAGKVTYSRLQQNPVTHIWETVHLKLQLNRILLGCLNKRPEEIPGNVLSRFICLLFFQYQRPGQYNMASCKLADTPEELRAKLKVSKERLQWLQMLVWWYALLMNTGVVQKPDFSVTNRFVEEVILLAKERGINGVSDYRVLDHILSLIEIVAIMDAMRAFWSEPGSPLAHLEYNDEQWLEVEKIMMPKVEHAVFVITLLSEQFETKVAYEVLHAISLAFVDSPYYERAKERDDSRANRRKAGGEGKESRESPLLHDDSDDDDDLLGPVEEQGQDGFLQLHPSIKDNAHWQEYFYFQVDVPLRGGAESIRMDERASYMCQKVYDAIEQKLVDKPERATCIHYLQSLLTSTVTSDRDRNTSLPALILKDNGICQIAKVLLRDLSSNRLVLCVQEVLMRPHYPKQRYVFGCQSSKAPQIWKTFSTSTKDLPTDAQKKRYMALRKHSQRVRENQMEHTNLTQAQKEAFLSRPDSIFYRFAAPERTIMNVVEERQDADWVLFREGDSYQNSAHLVDIDREDHAATNYLSNKVHFTPSVAASFVVLTRAADLQPSVRQAKEALHHKAVVTKFMNSIIAKEGKVDLLAKRRMVEARTRYPSCLASRNPTSFRHRAIEFAATETANYSLKSRSKKMSDVAGLGFDFGDSPPVEHKAEGKRGQQQQPPRPPQPPQQQPPRPPTPPRTPPPPEDDEPLPMDVHEESKESAFHFELQMDEDSRPGGGIPFYPPPPPPQQQQQQQPKQPQPVQQPAQPQQQQPEAVAVPNQKKRQRDDENSGPSPSKRHRGEAKGALGLVIDLTGNSNSNRSAPALEADQGSVYSIYKLMEQDEEPEPERPVEKEKPAEADPVVEHKARPKNKAQPMDVKSDSASSSSSSDDEQSSSSNSSNNAPPRRSHRVAANAAQFAANVDVIRRIVGDAAEDGGDDDKDYDVEADEEEDALVEDVIDVGALGEGYDSEAERELRGEDEVELNDDGVPMVVSEKEAQAEEEEADQANGDEEEAEWKKAQAEGEYD